MARKLKGTYIGVAWYGDEVMEAIAKNMPEGLYAMGTVLENAARVRAPKRSGALARSLYTGVKGRSNYMKRGKLHRKEFRIRNENSAVVAAAAYYAHMVEATGTEPHPIERKRKTLRIPGIGYRASVEHPGSRPRPFLGPALEATKDRMAQALARRLREALERKMGARR